MKDYYKILGIEENSPQEEIKKAYRGLAIKHHPDKGGDESMFKEINEAYENIGDPQKRSQYDNSRKNPFSGGGRGGASFEDLFANMFGGANPFEQRKPQAPQKIVKLKITPIESYLGVEKNIFYVREIGCQGCGGSGGEQQMCSGCNGEGFKVKTFGTGFMVQHVRATCDVCGGRRYTLVHKCYFCNGKGTKSESTELKIKIPVGIDSGQFLQMEGYGDFINGMVGNLLLQIEVEPANGFEKMGNDLIYNLYLNLEEIQSKTFLIPHPSGDLNLKSPIVVDTSKPLRLNGKGYNGGDMYVKLNLRFENLN